MANWNRFDDSDFGGYSDYDRDKYHGELALIEELRACLETLNSKNIGTKKAKIRRLLDELKESIDS